MPEGRRAVGGHLGRAMMAVVAAVGVAGRAPARGAFFFLLLVLCFFGRGADWGLGRAGRFAFDSSPAWGASRVVGLVMSFRAFASAKTGDTGLEGGWVGGDCLVPVVPMAALDKGHKV